MAKAIGDDVYGVCDPNDTPHTWGIALSAARAAIRAMREPTDEMMNRGTSTILIEHMTRPTKAAGNFVQFPASTSHDVWTAMITAASPEEPT